MNAISGAANPAIDAARLRAALADTRWRTVEVVEATGSTNADLIARAHDEGAASIDGVVRVTDDQTSGRGRHARAWTTPRGSAVAISAAVSVGEGTERLGWLSLVAGMAVAEAVEQTLGAMGSDGGTTVGVKWPNDVLVGPAGEPGAKVCGILSEYVAAPGGGVAVIGMGINTNMTAEQLPVPTATSLALTARGVVDPTDLVDRVLRALGGLLAQWPHDIDSIAAAYRTRSTTIDSHVRLILPDGTEVHGTAVDVDADGRVVVEDAQGLRTVAAAGDVTHLRIVR